MIKTNYGNTTIWRFPSLNGGSPNHRWMVDYHGTSQSKMDDNSGMPPWKSPGECWGLHHLKKIVGFLRFYGGFEVGKFVFFFNQEQGSSWDLTIDNGDLLVTNVRQSPGRIFHHRNAMRFLYHMELGIERMSGI